MSVIMTLVVKGDPSAIEKMAAADPERLAGVSGRAKELGIIAHRFYGSGDGRVMVVDEWPDEGSFQAFFEANRTDIESVMAEIGVSSEPEVSFWRKLDSHDEIGWEN